jgi:heat shock protein HspQ
MIAVNKDFREPAKSRNRPKFRPGQLVRHKRYAYRGVVVAFDRTCQADPDWYMSNKTQPDRNQPWYHVLVDGSTTCTYAAQENLREDIEGRPVQHPLVAHFFSGFEDGRHIRNDEPWPA